MKKIVFAGLLSAFFLVAAGADNTHANLDPHIIINEIQTSGASSSDEFIELFNPSSQDIDVSSWSIQYRGGSASTFYKKNFGSSDSIPAHGYFLIAHGSSYTGAMTYDMSWSQSLSESGGTIFLVSNQTVLINETAISSAVIDRVAYGAGSGLIPETTSSTPSPETGQSIERTDFIDTDNNAADFSVNISPSPQNSSITKDDDEESPDDEEPPYIPDSCTAVSQDIKLNEIFPYPESGNEFVEIKNTGENCVDVSGWKIMDEAGHKKEFPENSIIGSGEYIFLEGNLYLNNDSDTIYLLGKNGGAKEDALDSRYFEKAQKGLSYIFNGKGWSWTSVSTPGKENVVTVEEFEENTGDINPGENYLSAENVYLNEILPNPKKDSDGEYIEIVNGESGPVDLRGWMIRDASKSGKYVFKEHTEIGPGEYLAIYKSESKIALNNSKESVYLHNPRGEITSSASYEKSQKDASLNFDGKKWKWSKYLTPGKKNEFDSEPSVKIKKIKQTYKGLYTEFSAKAKDKETKKLKYAWDFGDGKRSSLQKTSHKYLDTGKYTVTLTVGDDSQTVEKSFVLAVKNYPRPDLEIVKILPNPFGNDSDGEIVEIRNNSDKKIDLRGWKIASGSDDKIYNHPISGEISLAPNETKAITREICKFSLNNKAGEIHLVMSDGKVIDEVAYQKEKIEEDEAYAKINGEWKWLAPTKTEITEKEKPSAEEDANMISNEENISDAGDVLGVMNETMPNYAPPQTGYTPEDKFIFFKFFGLQEYKPREATFCPTIQPASTLAYF